MKKVIKIEIPKVIWNSEMSIFNNRPILRTWMESIQDVINKSLEIRENNISVEFINVDKEQEMREFLKPFLTNLTIIHDEKCPNSVFYKQNGEVLFELYQNKKNQRFYVRYEKIWSVFYERFGLNFDDTQSFIKKEVESTLKLKGVTPVTGGILCTAR